MLTGQFMRCQAVCAEKSGRIHGGSPPRRQVFCIKSRSRKTYRDALLIYPNNPGVVLGLASTLALKGDASEAIELIERGLPLSNNEKHMATMRATLCFLYLKAGQNNKAGRLASELPHTRESREIIQPLIRQGLSDSEINENIKGILLGEGK